MSSKLRNIVSLVPLVVVLLIGASAEKSALAAFPERIIRIVVPQAPGGGTDAIARVLAQEMAKDLGGSVIVENKAGAGTIVGTQAVVSSEADGYTLLMGTFASAVNSSLIAKLPYDVHRDLAPVALIARAFNIVVVNPKSPLRSIADLDCDGEGRAWQNLVRHLRHRHLGPSWRRAVQEPRRRSR